MYSLLTMATQIIANVNVLAQTLDPNYLVSQNQVRQLRIPGDLIIGGVFPVHAKSNVAGGPPCGEILETRGIHRVEAMLYALDMINAQSDFLRGYKLGALILDSCSNPAYALNQSLDFVRELIGSTDVSEFQCSDGVKPEIIHTPKQNVVAVVGASYSSVTVQIANLLRLFRIVQVSPASTNADLSDKTRFEYFARTVPSDNYQARAMIDIARHFNWTYVSLVYSADEYGELGADAFKKEARRVNICIAIEERISMKREALVESVDNLVKKLQPENNTTGSRVVVLFVGTEYIPDLMEQTSKRMSLVSLNGEKKPKRIIWLASESWDRNNEAYTVGNRRSSVEGAIVLMLESQRVPSFEEYYLSLQPGTDKFERNKWLRQLWEHKFSCEFNLPEDSKINRCEAQRQSSDNFNADDKVQFVIEAVYAIAHALKAMKKDVCANDTIETSWISRHAKLPEVCAGMRRIDGDQFYKKYLLNVKFKDLVGKKVHFSPQGDGPAHYTILNYQPSGKRARSSDSNRGDYVEVGSWSEDRLHVDESLMFWNMDEVGERPTSVCSMPCPRGHKKQLIKTDEQCCWACGKCEPEEYLTNETTCVKCREGWFPFTNRTGCYDISLNNLEYLRYGTWHSFVALVFSILGIFITVCIIIIFITFNNRPIVKAAGRELSYVLLISMLMLYSMTYILIAKPSTLTCAIKRTGIGFSLSCLYSAIFVKANRIYRIFNQATRSAQPPNCISPKSQIIFTMILAVPNLILSSLWLLTDPPGVRHIYPERHRVILTCNIPDQTFLYALIYVGILIVMCTVYAVKTRKLPDSFRETQLISFTMYTTCVLWVAWIFFYLGTSQELPLQTASLCVTLSMSANVTCVCIFFPKVYVIFFKKQESIRKVDGDYIVRKSFRNLSHHSTMRPQDDEHATATQYTALLADQKRENSRKSSTQPSPSITSTAQDTFL